MSGVTVDGQFEVFVTKMMFFTRIYSLVFILCVVDVTSDDVTSQELPASTAAT